MVDVAHHRYVALCHQLEDAIDASDYAALAAMAARLRALPHGDERRVACLALHDVAAGVPLRPGRHFGRLLREVCQEEEELFLRLTDAWRSFESRRRVGATSAGPARATQIR